MTTFCFPKRRSVRTPSIESATYAFRTSSSRRSLGRLLTSNAPFEYLISGPRPTDNVAQGKQGLGAYRDNNFQRLEGKVREGGIQCLNRGSDTLHKVGIVRIGSSWELLRWFAC